MSRVARTHELRVGPVTRTHIVRFAGAGGDFNPMHHDESFARSAGQPGVFAMGQLSAALLARLSREWLGAEALRTLSVRFTAKLWPGDVLLLRGELADAITSGQEACWRCHLSATRASNGDLVARGKLLARAPEAAET